MKIKTIKFIPDVVRGYGNDVKRNGTLCTLFGLLLSGKENCSEDKPEPVIETPTIPQTGQIDIFANDETLREQEAKILADKAAEEERLRQIRESEEEKARRAEEAERKRKDRERKKKSIFDRFKKGFDNLSGELFGTEDTSDTMN